MLENGGDAASLCHRAAERTIHHSPFDIRLCHSSFACHAIALGEGGSFDIRRIALVLPAATE
jgi:hypothetical protein